MSELYQLQASLPVASQEIKHTQPKDIVPSLKTPCFFNGGGGVGWSHGGGNGLGGRVRGMGGAVPCNFLGTHLVRYTMSAFFI